MAGKVQSALVKMWKHCGPGEPMKPMEETVSLPSHYKAQGGPGDDDISIVMEGLPKKVPAADVDLGKTIDLRFDVTKEPLTVDAVHTFAVVRETINMYGDILEWPQSFKAGLTLHPRVSTEKDDFLREYHGQNAYYTLKHPEVDGRTLTVVNSHVICFGYFKRADRVGCGDPNYYTCHSLDIAAHESSHFILSVLKPGWWLRQNMETAALHESFADLSAIFLTLKQPDQVKLILKHSKKILHDRSYLAVFANEFERAIDPSRRDGLRNADNDAKMSDARKPEDFYNLSLVFTGAVYDILCDIYYHNLFGPLMSRSTLNYPDVDTCADGLTKAGAYLCRLVVKAIQASPDTESKFSDVVQQMLNIAGSDGSPPKYRSYILGRFNHREVALLPSGFQPDGETKKRLEIEASMRKLGSVKSNPECLTMKLAMQSAAGRGGGEAAQGRARGMKGSDRR